MGNALRLPSGAFFSDRGLTIFAWVEAIGAAALAVVIAALVWAALVPLGPVGTPPPAAVVSAPQPDFAVLQRYDPFYRAAAFATTETLSAESLGLRLYGLRGGGRPERGTAIISANNGPQTAYRTGESPLPGLVLREVFADHVILDRGGARLRLGFPPRNSGSTLAAAQPAGNALATGPVQNALELPDQPAQYDLPSGNAVEANFARFLTEASLIPRRVGNSVTGYRIETAGPAPEVEKIGLRAGDILTGLNGRALTSAEPIEELPVILAQGGEVILRYERGGTVGTVRVKGAPLKGR